MKAEINTKTRKIVINGEAFSAAAFRSFRPCGETIKNFYDIGFSLFSVFPSGVTNTLGSPYSEFGEVWVGEGKYRWENLDRQIELFIENAPNTYFSLMVHLDTRDWFLRDNPECADTFTALIQTAGHKKWRDEAVRFMCDMIDYVNKKYPERMYAVFIFAGQTCEWFTDYNDYVKKYNKPHEEAFRRFMSDETVEIPSEDEILNTSNGVFRNPIAEKNVVDYWRFHNEEVANTVCYFASVIKNYTNRSLITGAFFGYVVLGNEVISRGHNAAKKAFECDDIDLVFAPATYCLRGKENSSGSYIPIGSVMLHNKMYFHEIDNVTHLAGNREIARILRTVTHRDLKTARESTMYIRRESAYALAKNQGFWWFDMFSGWYDDVDVMAEISKINTVNNYFSKKDMRQISEVAMFVDTESNYYMDFNAKVVHDTVLLQTDELGKMGAPWDSYMLTDLSEENFPYNQYKLYVFANFYKSDTRIKEKIHQLRTEGKSVLFTYAPGYITDDGFSLDAMRELTGFRFEYAELKNIKKLDMPPSDLTGMKQISFEYTEPASPVFTALDGEAAGYYEGTDVVGFSIAEHSGSFAAWSGVGPVSWQVLNNLAKKAGVRVYLNSGDPLYMNSSMLGIYTVAGGVRTINLPSGTVLKSMYTDEVYKVSDGFAAVCFEEDETKLFEIISE